MAVPSLPTLLLVDDNDLDVEVVQRTVRRLALDVELVRAGNGEEALERLRGTGPSSPPLAPPLVVLLDINMPRMNGFELLEEMRGDEALERLPVYLLSTSDDPRDRRRAAGYGVLDYLVKPIDAARLRTLILSEDPGASAPSGGG